ATRLQRCAGSRSRRRPVVGAARAHRPSRRQPAAGLGRRLANGAQVAHPAAALPALTGCFRGNAAILRFALSAMTFLRPDRLSDGGSLNSLLLGRRWLVPVAFALPFVAVRPLLFHFRRT